MRTSPSDVDLRLNAQMSGRQRARRTLPAAGEFEQAIIGEGRQGASQAIASERTSSWTRDGRGDAIDDGSKSGSGDNGSRGPAPHCGAALEIVPDCGAAAAASAARLVVSSFEEAIAGASAMRSGKAMTGELVAGGPLPAKRERDEAAVQAGGAVSGIVDVAGRPEREAIRAARAPGVPGAAMSGGSALEPDVAPKLAPDRGARAQRSGASHRSGRTVEKGQDGGAPVMRPAALGTDNVRVRAAEFGPRDEDGHPNAAAHDGGDAPRSSAERGAAASPAFAALDKLLAESFGGGGDPDEVAHVRTDDGMAKDARPQAAVPDEPMMRRSSDRLNFVMQSDAVGEVDVEISIRRGEARIAIGASADAMPVIERENAVLAHNVRSTTGLNVEVSVVSRDARQLQEPTQNPGAVPSDAADLSSLDRHARDESRGTWKGAPNDNGDWDQQDREDRRTTSGRVSAGGVFL